MVRQLYMSIIKMGVSKMLVLENRWLAPIYCCTDVLVYYSENVYRNGHHYHHMFWAETGKAKWPHIAIIFQSIMKSVGTLEMQITRQRNWISDVQTSRDISGICSIT